jgi:hypothetical protein
MTAVTSSITRLINFQLELYPQLKLRLGIERAIAQSEQNGRQYQRRHSGPEERGQQLRPCL